MRQLNGITLAVLSSAIIWLRQLVGRPIHQTHLKMQLQLPIYTTLTASNGRLLMIFSPFVQVPCPLRRGTTLLLQVVK